MSRFIPSPQTLAGSARVRHGVAALVATGAMLVCLYYFCPRFSLWRGLDVVESNFNPEVNRAQDVLRQVDHPFAPIENLSNKVIRWRLLFPLVWHALSLPRRTLLAVPWVGVWLTLMVVAAWALRQTGNLPAALAITVLAGSMSWFFVSTGWLAYYDSWLMLALVVLTFQRNRGLVLATCFLAPWIDERLVFEFPLIWALRAAEYGGDGRRRLAREAAAESLAVAPYLALRCALLLSGRDVQAREYLASIAFDHRISWMAQGFWESMRAGWVAILGAALAFWRRHRRRELAAIAAGAGIALALNNHFAGDVGRTTSVLLPLLLFAGLECLRADPRRGVRLLGALAVINLVLPARNYFLGWSLPVYYFPREWERWNNPPLEVDPKFYLFRGMDALKQSDPVKAEHFFTVALQLDPGLASAHYQLGLLASQRRDWTRAQACFDAALASDPRAPDPWFWRALAKGEQHDRAGERRDLEQALRVAPSDWPGRQAANNVLATLP